MILCEYDSMRVARTPDGKWICKIYAMKGPTGLMMNKEIPEKWAAPIEKEYQFTLKNPDARFPKLKVIGEIKEDGRVIAAPKPEPKPKSKTKKPAKNEAKSKGKTKKRKNKDSNAGKIEKKPKKKASTLGGMINPFAK